MKSILFILAIVLARYHSYACIIHACYYSYYFYFLYHNFYGLLIIIHFHFHHYKRKSSFIFSIHFLRPTSPKHISFSLSTFIKLSVSLPRKTNIFKTLLGLVHNLVNFLKMLSSLSIFFLKLYLP